LVLASACEAIASVVGVTSEYYLTAPDTWPFVDNQPPTLFVVHGTSVVRQWGITYPEVPLAVSDTVRTYGYPPTTTGHEYSLDGTPTGASYSHPTADGGSYYDGTTDRTYNYAVDYNTGNVERFTSDWANPTTLFNIGSPPYDAMTITYDSTNNSLWIAGFYGWVKDVAMDGTVLTSFNTGLYEQSALALDPADGTLWLAEYGGSGYLRQYSKEGDPLQRIYVPELYGENLLGGEIASIPEPTTFIIWSLLGGFAIIAIRRRRLGRR
jgi:hypothetical protein